MTRSGDGTVTISCLKFDVIQEWRLEPHPDGCAVASVRVELPERDADRIDDQRAETGASLAGAAGCARRAGGGRRRLTVGGLLPFRRARPAEGGD